MNKGVTEELNIQLKEKEGVCVCGCVCVCLSQAKQFSSLKDKTHDICVIRLLYAWDDLKTQLRF